jgi:L-rhamnose isomerase
MTKLRALPISLHCWQGDDVGASETAGAALSARIQATQLSAKARTVDELRRT